MNFIDIGANLTHESFTADLAQVLERALGAGVTQIVVTGADTESSAQAAELAAAHAGLASTCGVHPHHARDCDASTIDSLRELLDRYPIVAIGETGLDFYRDFSPRPVQERWFVAHLELAVELSLPVFLHERDAHARFAPILREHIGSLCGAVVHCFTGDEQALEDYLDLGCHIGLTGWICDERRGAHLNDLVTRIPDERLMLETDAPYLLPRDLQPKPKTRRNEPAHLPHIARRIAAARGQGVDELASFTSLNARRFFGLSHTDPVT